MTISKEDYIAAQSVIQQMDVQIATALKAVVDNVMPSISQGLTDLDNLKAEVGTTTTASNFTSARSILDSAYFQLQSIKNQFQNNSNTLVAIINPPVATPVPPQS